MASNITLQVYITDTLTVVEDISLAVWLADDTTVSDSGVSDASGQLVSSLADASYTVRGFLDGYTVTETDFTVAGVAATVIVYADAVPYGAKTYSFYKDIIISNLKNKNDVTTLALILANFNLVQEELSTDFQFEDLQFNVLPALTASENTYSFSDLGISNLNEIYAIRLNDGTQWNEPMGEVSPIDWDKFFATIFPVVEDEPNNFTRRAKQILFYTTPNDTYTINIIGSLFATPVTGDASVVDFSNIDAILINRVTALTWLSLGEVGLHDKFKSISDDLLIPYKQKQSRTRYASSTRINTPRATGSK